MSSNLKNLSSHLIIVTCWNGKEFVTQKLIEERLELNVHVPLLVRRIIPRNRKSRFIVQSSKPLYPGYLFVEYDEGWEKLSGLHIYINRVLMRNATVPYLLRSDKLLMEFHADEYEWPFEEGDVVQVVEGVFIGFYGKIVNDAVELTLLGSSACVKLPAKMLRKVR